MGRNGQIKVELIQNDSSKFIESCAILYPGPQHPEPSSVYVDQRALRVDRVTVLERGAPHSVCLMECGKVGHMHHTVQTIHTLTIAGNIIREVFNFEFWYGTPN